MNNMTEKESHLFVAKKWFVIKEEMKKGEPFDESNEKADKKAGTFIFKNECSYCEKYMTSYFDCRPVCGDCPLNKIGQTCFNNNSWYSKSGGDIQAAESIYNFAKMEYKKL